MPLRPDLPPGSTTTTSAWIFSNFSADKLLFGHKIEAQTLRVSANNQSSDQGRRQGRGLTGPDRVPQAQGRDRSEVKLTATLDEAARTRFGLDVGPALAGPMPMKFTGVSDPTTAMVASSRADLTNTRSRNLLPGWVKPPGRQGAWRFTLVKQRAGGLRFEDVLIDGRASSPRVRSISTATAIC